MIKRCWHRICLIRPWRFVSIMVAVVLVATSLVGVALVLSDRHNALCRAQNANRTDLRALLIFARVRTEHNPALTAQQRRDSEEFYREALKRLPPLRCN